MPPRKKPETETLDAHVSLDRTALRKLSRFDTVGSTGLVRFGDDVDEEWLHALRDRHGVRAFREMRDNDSTVGASIYAIQSLIRNVRWRVDAAEASENPELAEEAALFLEECLEDMSHTWEEFIAEVLSFVWFGWSYFEKVYKIRGGPGEKDASRRSRYSDGKIGWRKISIRAQETLDGWEFDPDGGIRGMYQVAAPDYRRVLIPIEKSILFRTEIAKNNPEGRSLLRNGYRSWYFLKRLQELEAIGIERDLAGLPVVELPLAYFGADASPQKRAAKDAFARMIQQVRRNEHEGIVFPAESDEEGKPTGYRLRLLSSGGGRAVSVDAAIQRYEKRIAMGLLTQFLFLGQGSVGSFSLSSDQTDLFASALGSILNTIEETFARFGVAELMELNGYPPEVWPRLRHGDVERPDVQAFAATLAQLAQNGLITPDERLESHVRDELNLPPRDELEDMDPLEELPNVGAVPGPRPSEPPSAPDTEDPEETLSEPIAAPPASGPVAGA
jgi:hypothetical protein